MLIEISDYLTIPQAAKKLSIKRQSVYYYIKTGAIVTNEIAGRPMIHVDEVNDFKRGRKPT